MVACCVPAPGKRLCAFSVSVLSTAPWASLGHLPGGGLCPLQAWREPTGQALGRAEPLPRPSRPVLSGEPLTNPSRPRRGAQSRVPGEAGATEPGTRGVLSQKRRARVLMERLQREARPHTDTGSGARRGPERCLRRACLQLVSGNNSGASPQPSLQALETTLGMC